MWMCACAGDGFVFGWGGRTLRAQSPRLAPARVMLPSLPWEEFGHNQSRKYKYIRNVNAVLIKRQSRQVNRRAGYVVPCTIAVGVMTIVLGAVAQHRSSRALWGYAINTRLAPRPAKPMSILLAENEVFDCLTDLTTRVS